MQESFTLSADFNPIQLDQSQISIVAPGLVGQGTWVSTRRQGETRAFTGETTDLDRAIAEAGLEDRHTLVIEAPTPERAGGAGRGGAGVADDELLLEVPLGGSEAAFVMYTDEAGVISFHYREGTPSAASTSRSSAGQRVDQFRLPLRVAHPSPRGSGRGFFSDVAGKVIKVVVVGVFPEAAGGLVARAVAAWERRYRAFEGLHGGTWDQLLGGKPAAPDSLQRFVNHRSLLFIHGTTSTTAGAFEGLRHRSDMAAQISKAYDGRLLGFAHQTLCRSVAENVRDFYAALAKEPGHYTFDVICHSRGGLVARALSDLDEAAMTRLLGAPWTKPRDVTVEIPRIVFVATPNAGTRLAVPAQIPRFIERLANYVNLLPDSATVIAASAILATAASLTETALPRLPGLADQAPESELLRALGTPADPARRYFAFQANFHASGVLARTLADGAVDRLFEREANDVVVPTAGVSNTASFTIPSSRVVPLEGGEVHHTSFFKHASIGRITEALDLDE